MKVKFIKKMAGYTLEGIKGIVPLYIDMEEILAVVEVE